MYSIVRVHHVKCNPEVCTLDQLFCLGNVLTAKLLLVCFQLRYLLIANLGFEGQKNKELLKKLGAIWAKVKKP